jgi:farnesyl diphosphate synthase
MTLNNLFDVCQKRLEKIFQLYLVHPCYPEKQLQQAMAYAVQNGGKRIRPSLVYATGQVFKTALDELDAPACAVELIHAYSLIHDDLPAMDNSDLRRGKPTCHKTFGEATAILAGDALQPLAFDILVTHPSGLTAQQRLSMVHILSKASGIAGMAAGQALDLAGIDSIETLEKMYELKTGALLVASVQLGIASSHETNSTLNTALLDYIQKIGLAFQIQDDLLDILASSETTGKPQGLDQTNKKITYPAIFGIPKTQEKIQQLFSSALEAIEFIGNNAEILRELAYYLLQRKM